MENSPENGFYGKTPRHHEHVCPMWLAPFLSTPLRRLFQNPKRIIAPYLAPGQSAADIGCGPGYFTIPMAERAGANGKVYAIDLQTEMLELVRRAAEKAGVQERVIPVTAQSNTLNFNEKVDFALSFWAAHEVPDQLNFFREVVGMLKPGGKFLLIEPKLHTEEEYMTDASDLLVSLGLRYLGPVDVRLSMAMIFEK